jgi:hypothetical protein
MNPNGNRSLLSLAGEQSLGLNIQSKIQAKKNEKDEQNDILGEFDTKKILKKLTLPRLRKMQALIRGFIVRRTIYPR